MLFHQHQAIKNLCTLVQERTSATLAVVCNLSDFQRIDSIAEVQLIGRDDNEQINQFLSTNCHTFLLTPVPECENGKEKILVLGRNYGVKEDGEWTEDEIKQAKIAAEFIYAALKFPGTNGTDTKVHNPGSPKSTQTLSAQPSPIFSTNTYRKSPAKNNDLWFDEGRDRFINLVKNYVISGLPIPFVLPAFPFKSRNHETKVSGPLPDMGEKLALETLINFSNDVSAVYQGGAEVVVISDGFVFNDIYEISEEATETYRTKLIKMHKLGVLIFLGFDDFFPSDQSYATKRQKLMDLFGETKEVVQERINSDPAQKAIYCGMKKFMEQEFQCCEAEFGQRRKALKKVKDKCRQIMLRNEAYGRLIAALFPNHIRLSIHPHSNLYKYGITLIQGSEGNCGSPWHNVAVYHAANDQWETMKKSQAVERGFIFTADEEGFVYYFDGYRTKNEFGFQRSNSHTG